VSAAATETDTVFVDQATADVDGRTPARAPDEREAAGFVVR
jgi:hypothetical protein